MNDIAATGIILAGGLSKRMGRDKAFVELCGEALVSRVLKKLGQVCSDLIIVTNSPEKFAQFQVTLVTDYYPGNGSLGGIYSGLRASQTQYAFAVACDMPLLNKELMSYLLDCAEGYDVVIPSSPDPSKTKTFAEVQLTAKSADLHPLHAVYSKNCLTAIEARIHSHDLRMVSFHSDVRVRVVRGEEIDRIDPRHLSFFNINSPGDLEFARSILDCDSH